MSVLLNDGGEGGRVAQRGPSIVEQGSLMAADRSSAAWARIRGSCSDFSAVDPTSHADGVWLMLDRAGVFATQTSPVGSPSRDERRRGQTRRIVMVTADERAAELELDHIWFLSTFLTFGYAIDDERNPLQVGAIDFVATDDEGHGFSQVQIALANGDTYRVEIEKVEGES